MPDMKLRERWRALEHKPAVRITLLIIGALLMIAAPLVGILPGPGGVLVFAAGLAVTLRYSAWAKRRYVAFKRAHPRKGDWADWGLRRPSARRRAEIRKREAALMQGADD